MDVKIETKSIDRGANGILREISKVGSGMLNRGSSITVGYHAPENAKMSRWRKKTQGRAPVGQLAEWNEFGTEFTPKRPTLRPSFDESVNKFVARTQSLMRKMYRGQISFEQLMEQQGKWLRTQLRRKIRMTNKPRNEPDWERRKTKKGLNPWPLKATGSMIKAANYRTHINRSSRDPLTKMFNKVEKELRDIKL